MIAQKSVAARHERPPSPLVYLNVDNAMNENGTAAKGVVFWTKQKAGSNSTIVVFFYVWNQETGVWGKSWHRDLSPM